MTDNSIGNFQVGISPIGNQRQFSYLDTVQAQFANSPTILRLIENMVEYIDMTADMDAFYDMVFNVETAQGVGLDIWGRIVGVSRVIPTGTTDIEFGFAEAGSLSATGFGQGDFYSGTSVTSNVSLSDDAFRLLIYAKMMANITDCSIPSINSIMRALFPGRGDCHVQDNLDMTLTYVFNFSTTAVEKAVIQGSGVLPKPTGVYPIYSFA